MADIFNFYVYDDRSIQFAIAEPIMLEDKDVTQFRFRIPKSLNGFGMSDWEWWFIFVNPKGTKYTTLLELSDDEDEPEEYSVATYTVGYGFSGIVGTVRFSIEALNVSGEEIVNEWHTKTYSTAVIDTLQGLRAVIPEPEGQAASGLTQQEKNLILQLFNKAAYAEDDAKASYDALEALWSDTPKAFSVTYRLTNVSSSNKATSITSGASYSSTLAIQGGYRLNTVTVTMGGVDVTATYYNSGTITIPSVTGNIVITATAVLEVSSLSAVYTQSGTVYDTDSLDVLKSDLVVTANYSGGTSETVPASDYTLSGTLTEGTSTITVSYAGLTVTFNVTVTEWQPITESITWSGSGSDKISTVVDATEYDVYLTVPFDSTSSDIASGSTSASEALKGYATLYTDSAKTTRYAYYYFDTEETRTSGYRTNSNCPIVNFDTKIKIAPKGYYVTLTLFKAVTETFPANSNVLHYLNEHVTSVTLE